MIGIYTGVILQFLSNNNHRSLDSEVQRSKVHFPGPVAPQWHKEFYILAALSSLSCKLEPTARVSSADPREPTDLAQKLRAL